MLRYCCCLLSATNTGYGLTLVITLLKTESTTIIHTVILSNTINIIISIITIIIYTSTGYELFYNLIGSLLV